MTALAGNHFDRPLIRAKRLEARPERIISGRCDEQAYIAVFVAALYALARDLIWAGQTIEAAFTTEPRDECTRAVPL